MARHGKTRQGMAKPDNTWYEIHLDWEAGLKSLQSSFVELWSNHLLASKAGKSFPTRVLLCPIREGKRVGSHGSRPVNLLVFGKWGDFVVTQSLFFALKGEARLSKASLSELRQFLFFPFKTLY